MKIIGLEEHYCVPEVMEGWRKLPADLQDMSLKIFHKGNIEAQLKEFAELPELQIILGHWGEVVLFYLERIDMLSEVKKNV